MILAFELEPELERSLENDAKQKHISASEMVKNFLIQNYFSPKKSTDLLSDIVKDLPEIACFKNKDLLEIQKVMRDEKTISPITQSLIGLLANSNLDETDYKKHLEDKYL
jgi:hypothetical protein